MPRRGNKSKLNNRAGLNQAGSQPGTQNLLEELGSTNIGSPEELHQKAILEVRKYEERKNTPLPSYIPAKFDEQDVRWWGAARSTMKKPGPSLYLLTAIDLLVLAVMWAGTVLILSWLVTIFLL